MTSQAPPRSTQAKHHDHPPIIGGLLPFIGVFLFLIATLLQFAGGAGADWGQTLLTNAIVYVIGVAGIGAGISHIFFGRRISRTIGFDKSPYELEVGFADLAIGIAGVLAASFSRDYWIAVIMISSIFRVGCGIGHVVSMIRNRNFAVNNIVILVIDFGAPVFLVIAYLAVAT